MLLRVACLCAAVAVAGASAEASRPADGAPLARPDLLRTLVARTGAPGAAVAVETAEGRWSGTRGFAELTPRRRMTATTRFRVFDVTQAFVGAALLDAMDDDRTHLEERVSAWLYTLDDEVLVRHLYLHTSGLLAGGRVVPAGQQFSYNPRNYVLLADVLEAATGSSMARQVRERVLIPLGLQATAYDARLRPPSLARQYNAQRGPAPRALAPPLAHATGVVSTPVDLAHFVRTLLAGEALSERRTRELTTISTRTHAFPAERFGLGLFSVRTPCGVAWGHRGRGPGTTTWMFATSDGSRAVAASVNIGGLSLRRLLTAEQALRAALCD
jgi:D-alanyl-D-alanine carboxypeptidase